MAITVDDLPAHGKLDRDNTRPAIAQKMLEILQKHHIPEVYGFINAHKIDDDPALLEILNIWHAAGYPLGNHTWSHQDIDNISVQEFEGEIAENEATLKKVNNGQDWKYFRYPFLHEGNSLESRNAVRQYLHKSGYKIAEVSVDFADWSWNEPYARCKDLGDLKSIAWLKSSYLQNANDQLERADILMRGLFHRSVPQVLLLHIGAFDAEMIDGLLAEYEKKGVKFISLSEALKDEAYAIDPGIAFPSGMEFTYQIMKSRKLSLKDFGLKPYQDYPNEKLSTICPEEK